VGIRLSRLPVVRKLFCFDAATAEPTYSTSEDDSDAETSFRGSSKKGSRTKGRSKPRVKNGALLDRHSIVVTPIVGRIASRLFVPTLKVAGQSTTDADVIHRIQARVEEYPGFESDDELRMTWLEETGHPGFYYSVMINKVTYSVSVDFVFAYFSLNCVVTGGRGYCRNSSWPG